MWGRALLIALPTFCSGFTVVPPPLAKRHASINLPNDVRPLSSVSSPPAVETLESTSEKKALAVLLRQTENFLTGSSLVYLYAELRLLSYCGYTKTPFHEIDCNRWAGSGDEGSIRKTQGFTALRLLETFLQEIEWTLQGRKTLNSKDWTTLW